MVPLTGGLTNLSYVVDDAGEKFVCVAATIFPSITSSAIANGPPRGRARRRLSPEVIYGEPGLLVMRFIDGRTFAEADLRANIHHLASLLRKCHREVGQHLAGPPNFFSVFHVIRDYGRTITAADGPFAADVPRFLEAGRVLEAAQVPMPIIFGHHDLLPGNVMDDGRRLWLIDWEYGGFGTAMFDLANLSPTAPSERPRTRCFWMPISRAGYRPSCGAPSRP